MSRRLPIVGQLVQAPVTSAPVVSTVWVDGAPIVAVVEAQADVGADAFVQHLVVAVRSLGRTARVERTLEPAPDTCLLAIIGSHVPRAKRRPEAQALWERADLLLSEPSRIVADALAHAV